MGPIVHRVSKPGDWPERVAPLARALSHSFPVWVAAGPYPAVSAFAQRSLSMLQQQVQCHPSTIPPEHIEFPDPDLGQQLAFMFDFILSISTLVREIASSPYRVHCTRSLWLSFATAVWRSVSHDLSIRREVGFVKPRQPGDHPLSESDFDGNATLVLSHVVMPVAASPSEDSDTGTPPADTKDEPSSDSSPQASPIEVPFEAHILAGTGIRYFAELPVFVIVDPENFAALLSGVVYQRHVWGIDEPAIGLVLSESENIGQIVFSWIDTSGANDPPLVHFATAADDCQAGSPLGIFDLSMPLDVFAFAQFVLQLRNHHRVIAEASACGCTSFSWRSDLVVEDPLFGEQCEDIIKRWGQAVDQNDDFCGEKIRASLCQTQTRTDNEVAGESPTSNWLMEHNVFAISRVALSGMDGFNEKIKLYDQITEAGWIKGWTDLAHLPLPSTEHFRELQAEVLASSKKMPDLPPNLGDLMKSHFLFVMLIAQFGGIRHATSFVYGATEADCRHVWDTLLLWFTGNLNDNDRVYDVHFERALNAPRNPMGDGTRTNEGIFKSFSDWTASNMVLANQMSSALYAPPYPTLFERDPPDDLIHLRAQLFLVAKQAERMSTNLAARSKEDFLATVKNHLAAQPQKGICDAIVVAVVPSLVDKSSVPRHDRAFKAFLAQLTLVHPVGSSGVNWKDIKFRFRKQVDAALKAPEEGSSTPTQLLTVPKDPSPPNNGEQHILRDAFINYYPLEHTRATPPKSPDDTRATPTDKSSRRKNDLFLPILVVEYKKRNYSALHKAMNQCRAYLVSSLCFLNALGLGDEPVFGLVVNGHEGILTMGWRDDNGMFSMERNCRSYNLEDPMSVFQFAVVLLRLAQRRKAVIEKFEDKRQGLRNALELRQGLKYESLAWSKAAQLSKTGATAEIQA